jgi:hypothetical protein
MPPIQPNLTLYPPFYSNLSHIRSKLSKKSSLVLVSLYMLERFIRKIRALYGYCIEMGYIP